MKPIAHIHTDLPQKFATRSPFRPNPIGLTCAKLDRVESTDEGPIIHVLNHAALLGRLL